MEWTIGVVVAIFLVALLVGNLGVACQGSFGTPLSRNPHDQSVWKNAYGSLLIDGNGG